MKIQPLKGRVVIEPEAPMFQTKSGLIIPDEVAEDEAPAQGEIIAVAKGSQFKVGQYVLYKKYAAHPVELEDDKEIVIIDEEDLTAIISKPKK